MDGVKDITKDTPDVEVLHVTQKSRNASVACNTSFLAGDRPALSPLSLNFTLYHHNMG